MDILSDPNRIEDNSIDLIYLDPPFNSKSIYNLPFSKAMIRQQDLKPVMAFKDTWSWSDNEVEHLAKLKEGRGNYTDTVLASIVDLVRNIYQERGTGNSMGAYLLNMAIRLKTMKRVLKETGSVYLHCDHTASHYLKMLLDAIWETSNFRNEIVWCYAGGGGAKKGLSEKTRCDFQIRREKQKV